MGKTTGEVLKKFDAAQNGRSQAAPSKNILIGWRQ